MQRHEPWSFDAGAQVTLEHGVAIPPTVLAFLQRLKRLPLGVWADVAFSRTSRPADVVMATATTTSLAAARATLRRVIDGRSGLAVRIRQRVHELVSVAEAFLQAASTGGPLPPTVHSGRSDGRIGSSRRVSSVGVPSLAGISQNAARPTPSWLLK